mgnify:CR=1 FL=1
MSAFKSLADAPMSYRQNDPESNNFYLNESISGAAVAVAAP